MPIDEAAEPSKPSNRCDLPTARDHADEKRLLFVEQLHRGVTERDLDISPFFIRRSVYFAFFGRPRQNIGHSRVEPSADDVGLSGQIAAQNTQSEGDNSRANLAKTYSEPAGRRQEVGTGSQDSSEQTLREENERLKTAVQNLEQEKRKWDEYQRSQQSSQKQQPEHVELTEQEVHEEEVEGSIMGKHLAEGNFTEGEETPSPNAQESCYGKETLHLQP